MKKLTAILMVLILIMSSTMVANAQNTYEEPLLSEAEQFDMFFAELANEHGVEYASNYFRSIDALNTFATQLPQISEGSPVFPDNFGGAYIDGNGIAVLLLTRGQAYSIDSNTEATLSQLQNSLGVMTRHVNFSYNELRLTIDRLNHLLAADYVYPALQNASAWYIDTAGNRVVVELTDYSREAIHLFNTTIMHSPVIQFEQAPARDGFDDEAILDINIDDVEMTPHNIRILAAPGDGMRPRRQTENTSSIGYRASLNGVRGFITAAHAVRAGDEILSGTTRVGHVANESHIALANADAAFVTLYIGVDISDNVDGMRISGESIPYIWQGQTIYHAGMVTGIRGATILGAGLTVPLYRNGILVTTVINAIRTSYPSAPGDSGGIVFAWAGFGAGSTTPYGVVGITVGGNGTTSVVSTFPEINRRLGTSLRW